MSYYGYDDGYAPGYGAEPADETLPGSERGARAQFLVNLAGALVSLTLVGGMGVWGYKLLVRDVSGVPVIEAMEGPFRAQPDDPGGMTAPHQGLQVNEIAALGTAGGPVDEVRLAPASADLEAEDRPWADLAATPVAAVAEVPGAESGASAQGGGRAAAIRDDLAGEALATDVAVAEALAAIAAEAGGERAAAPEPAVAGGRDLARGATVAALAVASPRPVPRPAAARAATASASASAPASRQRGPGGVGAGEVAIADLDRGTRLVQLGAYASPEIARSEWATIGGRFRDFFDGKRMVVQKAVSGGTTFFRLRAEGFADLADARRFCSALMAKRADCIPVEVR